MSDRPETGPMRFDGDWTGVFVRGDNCYNYANFLEDVLASKNSYDLLDAVAFTVLHDLMTLLRQSYRDGKSEKEVQKLKKFLECLPDEEPSRTDESCSQGDTTDKTPCTCVKVPCDSSCE